MEAENPIVPTNHSSQGPLSGCFVGFWLEGLQVSLEVFGFSHVFFFGFMVWCSRPRPLSRLRFWLRLEMGAPTLLSQAPSSIKESPQKSTYQSHKN